MKNVLELLFLLNIFSHSHLLANKISVSQNIDQTTILEEDNLRLSVDIKGALEIENIELDLDNNFEALSQSTSSSQTIINGYAESLLKVTYTLRANKTGLLIIKPTTVTIDGEKYTSQALKVKVLDSSSQPTNQKKYFLETTISNDSPFKNQTIIYSLKLYSRVKLAKIASQIPNFDGFWQEKLGKETQYTKEKDGINWNVHELKYALYPEKAGPQSVAKTKLVLDIVDTSNRQRRQDPFFGNFFGGSSFKRIRQVTLTSNVNEINVKELPLPPSPNYKTNIVGSLMLQSKTDKIDAMTGDSITYTITASGFGNLRDLKIKQPNIKNSKIYSNKATIAKEVKGDSIFFTKTFTFAIIPRKAGKLVLPKVHIAYFDPDGERYQLAKSNKISLNIKKNPDAASNYSTTKTTTEKSQPEQTSSIKELGSDLLPLKTEFNNSSNTLSDNLKNTLLSIIILVYLLLVIFKSKYLRPKFKSIIINRKKSDFTLKDLIANMQKLNKDENTNIYHQSLHYLKKYLAAVINKPALVLSSSDINTNLFNENINIQNSNIEKLKSIFYLCESAEFSSGSINVDKDKIISQVIEVAQNIDKDKIK